MLKCNYYFSSWKIPKYAHDNGYEKSLLSKPEKKTKIKYFLFHKEKGGKRNERRIKLFKILKKCLEH